MARGRMISQTIVLDRDINNLSCDTSRLAYTWLITFADAEGRTYGDPAIVRSMLFPRRDDITTEQIEIYIKEWADLGIIIWYEARGDLWIYFPAFTNHNRVDKTREAVSRIPEPTPEQLASYSRVNHEKLHVKLIKVKDKSNLIESKSTEINDDGEIFKLFSDNICFITPMLAEQLKSAEKEYGTAWIKDAIKIAVENNARNMKYIEAILRNRKSGKSFGKNGRGKKQTDRRDTEEARAKYAEVP